MLAYLDLSQPSALQELQSPIECLRLVPVLHLECTHCSTNMAFEGFVLFFFLKFNFIVMFKLSS